MTDTTKPTLSPEERAERIKRFKLKHAAIDVQYWMSAQSLDDAAVVLASLEEAEGRATQVPAGYRLVPIKPTETMLLHGCKAGLSMATLLDDTRFACERAVWSAMLQASPSNSEADNHG